MQGGMKKSRFATYRAILDCMVLTAYAPRNADWSISWSFPYQFAPNSHAVFLWGTATLERSLISKNRFMNLEFCRRKTVVTASLQLCPKSIN